MSPPLPFGLGPGVRSGYFVAREHPAYIFLRRKHRNRVSMADRIDADTSGARSLIEGDIVCSRETLGEFMQQEKQRYVYREYNVVFVILFDDMKRGCKKDRHGLKSRLVFLEWFLSTCYLFGNIV